MNGGISIDNKVRYEPHTDKIFLTQWKKDPDVIQRGWIVNEIHARVLPYPVWKELLSSNIIVNACLIMRDALTAPELYTYISPMNYGQHLLYIPEMLMQLVVSIYIISFLTFLCIL